MAALALVSSVSLNAQAHAPGFERFELRAESENEGRPTFAVFDSRDYRYEGAIVGGLLVGGALAILGNGLCASSDSTRDCTTSAVLAFAGGGALGALAGLLIGGAIEKTAPSTNPGP